MRRKKAFKTIITALILQVVLIIVNLILPHCIIKEYGSSTNGLINSITQFLSYIALLETGIGAVVKSVLYKSLAKKDNKEISKIYITTRNFFRKIAVVLVIYIIILCLIYPHFVSKEFEILYTISLILIISIKSFMQYYLGLANQILIQSDQKGYVINICKIITYILSTIVMVIMINFNCSIQSVKLIGTLILIMTPLYSFIYTKKNYQINKTIKPDNKVIKNRWDGFSHQISYFIHTNTDITILTIFSTMKEVSVYSVYALVTNGIKSIINTLTSSMSAVFGNLHGNNEKEKLSKQFILFDYFNLLIVIFIFTIAGALITPFVKLYVSGVNDANYNRIIFGIILVIAEAIYCLRCSYSNIIFVVGDFKETKIHGYIESGLNIIISLLLIKSLGLIGISIGTLIGMIYRLIVSILYVKRNIININIKNLIKKYLASILSITIFILIINIINFMPINSYMDFIICAIVYCAILGMIMVLVNLLICKKELIEVYNEYLKKR